MDGSAQSFALNCQFVLGLMQCGSGGSEAGVMITFLNLPHASTFEKTSFLSIQTAIRPEIVDLSEKSMEESRCDEIAATIGQDKFKDWKNKKIKPEDVKLTVSYDMGWNKRSSGTKYDSMSGHGFVLGSQTKRVLQFKVLSKQCSKCSFAAKTLVTPPKHECPKNHIGSSKSMETEAIFRMVKEAFDHIGYNLSIVVIDDDITTKSNLKHSWEELIKEGKLRRNDWSRTLGGTKKRTMVGSLSTYLNRISLLTLTIGSKS